MRLRTAVRKSRNAIKSVAIYAVVMCLFFGGYILSSMNFTRPISDEQYEKCQEILHSVYTKQNKIIDLPSNMYFDKSNMKVGVHGYKGYAQAKGANSNLMIVRNYEKFETISINFLTGILLAVIGYLLLYCVRIAYEKIRDME